MDIEETRETLVEAVKTAVTEHERVMPHAGISREETLHNIRRLNELQDLMAKVIVLLEGETRLDLRGNARVIKPGVVAQLETLQEDVTTIKDQASLRIPVPAWVLGAATAAGVIYQAFST